MKATIYKIVPATLWHEAERSGFFAGSPVDLLDGYIHFSTDEQVAETAAKHFKGQEGLLLAAIDADGLKSKIKYEPSRGGALFPHLYEPLDLKHVRWVRELPLDANGVHLFPALESGE